uniref:C2H2-type domain-containing protein n=1 Tax=Eptatretus burgeri TaxID=7764 RepID=A0A8C4NC33_EPTBU
MDVVQDVDIAYPDASKSKTRAVSDKLYICSFDGCSAVFSSSRRLRHHLCYHTVPVPTSGARTVAMRRLRGVTVKVVAVVVKRRCGGWLML